MVHEGHKTHNGQVTDHTALTKHDVTAYCRVGPIQSLLQQSREKSKDIAHTAHAQLHIARFPSAARLLSQLLPPPAPQSHTEVSLCLELLPAATCQA